MTLAILLANKAVRYALMALGIILILTAVYFKIRHDGAASGREKQIKETIERLQKGNERNGGISGLTDCELIRRAGGVCD